MWNLMTQKLAIPWKTEGFVVSGRNVYLVMQLQSISLKEVL